MGLPRFVLVWGRERGELLITNYKLQIGSVGGVPGMTIQSTGRTLSCHSERPEGVEESVFSGGCGSFGCAALAQDDSTKYGMTIQSTGRTLSCHSEHPARGVEESVPLGGMWGERILRRAALAQDDSTKYGAWVERTVGDDESLQCASNILYPISYISSGRFGGGEPPALQCAFKTCQLSTFNCQLSTLSSRPTVGGVKIWGKSLSIVHCQLNSIAMAWRRTRWAG